MRDGPYIEGKQELKNVNLKQVKERIHRSAQRTKTLIEKVKHFIYIYIHTDHHTELDEQRPPEREEEEEKDEKGGRCTDHFVGSCITRLKGLCLRGG